MKKLLAILFIASIGAVLFAAETDPTTGEEPQATPETRQRPFFTDKNHDGICDNYRDFPPPMNRGRQERNFPNNRGKTTGKDLSGITETTAIRGQKETTRGFPRPRGKNTQTVMPTLAPVMAMAGTIQFDCDTEPVKGHWIFPAQNLAFRTFINCEL